MLVCLVAAIGVVTPAPYLRLGLFSTLWASFAWNYEKIISWRAVRLYIVMLWTCFALTRRHPIGVPIALVIDLGVTDYYAIPRAQQFFSYLKRRRHEI
jgi:hypothetical protein